MSYEFNILYYIDLYKKSWKIILRATVISIPLIFCLALFRPTTYVSSATLLSTGGTSGVNYGDSTLSRFLGIASSSSPWQIVGSVMSSRRMANDVREHFKLCEKPGFWWRLNPVQLQSGIVEVSGSDPALTQQITTFCIENLDKINVELDITANKPMVRVLDSATFGSPISKQIPKKIFIGSVLIFLSASFYVFFVDYYKKLKGR
ncbi:MAG: hypothetical protein PHO42_04710 [Candidatus Omnitrophica bacterium]|nr:hypothetical protein [Candidatus Omnitrophota bacterium]